MRKNSAQRRLGLNSCESSYTGNWRSSQAGISEVFVSNGGVHHVPVLATEVMDALAPAPGQTVVDATIGVGGHAKLLMDRLGPDGRLVGLDRDARMLALLKREAW